jgi:hypothetical protein
VELTAGQVIRARNGRRMKAPDTPAMEGRDETTNATNGGRKTRIFTPDTGNGTYRFCTTEAHCAICNYNALVASFIIAQKIIFERSWLFDIIVLERVESTKEDI